MSPNPIAGSEPADNPIGALAFANLAANPETLVTVIRSIDPPAVGKTFDYVDGRLQAVRRQNITRGTASTELATETADSFARLLRDVTEEANSVLVPGVFNGDEDGTPFNIVTERELGSLTGFPIGAPEFSRILDVNGQRYAARLKRAIQPSCWLLFDFDRGVAGMPEEWRTVAIGKALAMYEPVLPGVSTAERIVYRSSSARVIGPNRPLGRKSHAWVSRRSRRILTSCSASLLRPRMKTAN